MIKTARLILVTGAARSGKSHFAEEYVSRLDKQAAYLATAQALDEEMAARIANHRQQRPSNWVTFEEPLELGRLLKAEGPKYPVWLLDCVTLYISNLFMQEPTVRQFLEKPESNFVAQEVEESVLSKVIGLLQDIRTLDITLVAVTNEVGWGLVPPDPFSRAFRDVVGRVNQLLAREAEEVYLVTVGIAQRIK